jgi:hypothetical protein
MIEEVLICDPDIHGRNDAVELTAVDLRHGLNIVVCRRMTLREERRLMVFDNRVLRRIFGPKRDKVTREWRKLRNEVLHDLYCSPNIVRVIKSRRMRWAGYVARMGEEIGGYRVLVGKETTGEAQA